MVPHRVLEAYFGGIIDSYEGSDGLVQDCFTWDFLVEGRVDKRKESGFSEWVECCMGEVLMLGCNCCTFVLKKFVETTIFFTGGV